MTAGDGKSRRMKFIETICGVQATCDNGARCEHSLNYSKNAHIPIEFPNHFIKLFLMEINSAAQACNLPFQFRETVRYLFRLSEIFAALFYN
jgi:hypothetical protein